MSARTLDEEALTLFRAAGGDPSVTALPPVLADLWRRIASAARELHAPAPEPEDEHWEIRPRDADPLSRRVLLLNHDRRRAWPFPHLLAAERGLEYLRERPEAGVFYPFDYYNL